jgi:hypothetical protein
MDLAANCEFLLKYYLRIRAINYTICDSTYKGKVREDNFNRVFIKERLILFSIMHLNLSKIIFELLEKIVESFKV